jgi:hypothetical protein
LNTGKFVSASGYTEVAITLKNVDATVVVDTALADSYRYGPEKFMDREAINALQQAFFVSEQQFWYGTGAGASAGFSGLGDDSHYSAAAGSLVVNAGGTTAATGSSVWLILLSATLATSRSAIRLQRSSQMTPTRPSSSQRT